MRYRVVTITNNVIRYAKNDNAEFPRLIRYVRDECSTLVVDEEGEFWYTTDFFAAHDIKSFTV